MSTRSPGLIAKNVGILMGMEACAKVFTFAATIVLARYLAPRGFGLLAFALAFVSMFNVIAGFGMSSLTMRDLARDHRLIPQYLSNGLIAKALLSVVALGVISGVMWGMGYSPEKRPVVLLAALVMVLEATMRFTDAFFQSAQRMGVVAVANLAYDIGTVICALMVVWVRGSVLDYLTGRMLVLLVVLGISVWLIHIRLGRLAWHCDLGFIWRMLKGALPFALSTLFVAIYVDIDLVMLSFMKGDVMTGWYAAAGKFLKGFSFIPVSTREGMLPAMAKFSRDDPDELVKNLARSCRYLAMVALPIVGGIFMLAPQFVVLFFGSAYQAAIPALHVLIWTLFFMFLNSALWVALVAVDRERQATIFQGIGALVNIVTNLIAIPRWGHVGAAATTVLSFATVFGLDLMLLRRALPKFRLLREVIKPVCAMGAMMGFIHLSQGSGLGTVIVGSVVVYLGCLIVLRAIGAEELALLRGLGQRKRVQVQ